MKKKKLNPIPDTFNDKGLFIKVCGKWCTLISLKGGLK